MQTGDVQRLAAAVRQRREELRLGQHEISARHGPAVGTIQDIEAGLPKTYRSRSLEALDRSLGWETGSCQRILDGADPLLTLVQEDFILIRIPDYVPQADRDRARQVAEAIARAGLAAMFDNTD